MKLAEEMKVLLADTFALYLKAHNFHWNVVGKDFHQYHAFFGEIYKQLHDAVDLVAEEIRQLGVFVPGSLGRFQALTAIKDEVQVPECNDMVSKLYNDNQKVLATLEKVYKLAEDNQTYGLSNFIQDRMMEHQRLAWQLSSSMK